MECSGFRSPRSDAFPVGLRVLVVDDDQTWLKILEKMLNKCSYQVSTCGLAREALDLLRERKDGFDIVISDVNMPDMDGFKLLERVGLELDLPVIMMSVDGETSRVMKGVQHGACDYLLKPIRMKELKNIWQHVLRKRIHDVKETDSDGLEEIQINGSLPEYGSDFYSFSMVNMCSGKTRRKDAESKQDDKEYSDTFSVKKPRVVWTIDLHQKFVKAVNLMGIDKVGPKKILDLMEVSWLTRENVASHLQKYRLYLSRLQNDGEIKDTSFTGVRREDVPPRDPAKDVLLQGFINAPHNDVRSDNCSTSGRKIPMQNIDVKSDVGGIKELASCPDAAQMKDLIGDVSDGKKRRNQCLSSGYSFHLPSSDVKLTDSVPSQYLWTTDYQQINKQISKSHLHIDNKLNHLPPKKAKIQQNKQDDTMRASAYFSHGIADIKAQGIREVPQAESEVDLFAIQSECHMTSSQQFGQISSSAWSTKNGRSSADQILIDRPEFAQRKESLNNVLQGVHQQINVGINNGYYFDCIDRELLAAVTPLYESLEFNYEYPFDSMEYPVLDQSLFIV